MEVGEEGTSKGRSFLNRAFVTLAIPIIASLAIAGVSLLAIRTVMHSHETLIDDYAVDLINVEKLRSAFEWKVAASRGFFLTKDPLFLEREAQARQEYKNSLARLKGGVLPPHGKTMIADIEHTEEAHQAAVDRVKDIRKNSDDIAEAVDAFEKEVFPKREKLRLSIEVLGKHVERLFEEAKAAAKRDERSALWQVILAATAAILLAAYLARISVHKLAHAYQKEAEGRKHAEAAAAARAEFLSVASHELRTPLTSLHIQLQMLSRLSTQPLAPPSNDPFKETMAHKIDAALNQCVRLNSLIDTLLDMTRLTEGRLELHWENFDLAQLIRTRAIELEEYCKRMGCSFTLDLPDHFNTTADPLRLGQAITNIISNAIKYGEGKPVEISLRSEDAITQIRVKDQGRGISESDQIRIFHKFERAVPSEYVSGLGLGLYISRQLVEAHGGLLTVDSKLGHGSTFLISLPKKQMAQ